MLRITLQSESCPFNIEMPRPWQWPQNAGDMAWRRRISQCFYRRNRVLKNGSFFLARLAAQVPAQLLDVCVAQRGGVLHKRAHAVHAHRISATLKSKSFVFLKEILGEGVGINGEGCNRRTQHVCPPRTRPG